MRICLAVALTLICTAVFGHGSEQWINDAKLVDQVSKILCCGPTDCSVLAPGSVERGASATVSLSERVVIGDKIRPGLSSSHA
jgi:hypothetical protein